MENIENYSKNEKRWILYQWSGILGVILKIELNQKRSKANVL